MSDTQQTEQSLDSVERSIDIDAPAGRVFDLVSRPGWWINYGTVDADPRLTSEGDVALLVDDEWGEFRIQTLASDPPRYVSFRWIDREDPAAGTTVEFWITDRGDASAGTAGVTLRVLESGFTELGKPHDQVVTQVQENTEGWETELAAARSFIVGHRG